MVVLFWINTRRCEPHGSKAFLRASQVGDLRRIGRRRGEKPHRRSSEVQDGGEQRRRMPHRQLIDKLSVFLNLLQQRPHLAPEHLLARPGGPPGYDPALDRRRGGRLLDQEAPGREPYHGRVIGDVEKRCAIPSVSWSRVPLLMLALLCAV